MVVDGSSIKERVDHDNNLYRSMGFIELGGLLGWDDGDGDLAEEEVCGREIVKEMFVVMLVGLKSSWKLAVGYFPIKRCPGSLVASVINKALIKSFNIGIQVVNVTMDGKSHNLSAFNSVGARMIPKEHPDLRPFFPHPSD